MLYLTRKIGESVIINNTIEMTVVEVKGRAVKIGFNFPPEATILRKELHDKILQQNLAAAQSGDDVDIMDAVEGRYPRTRTSTMAEEEGKQETPTLAVALKYDRGKEPAPRVVAKGRGTIAEQIIRIAEEHGVTIHEDANLVEVLEKLDLDAVIPLEAYAAVAEILNYVYKANAQAKAETRKAGRKRW